MKPRVARWLAWSIWGLTIASLLAPLVGKVLGTVATTNESGSILPFIAVLIFIPTFASVGAILASKRPSNPIGWLLAGAGLSYALGTLAIEFASVSQTWSDWLGNWAWGAAIGLVVPFVLLLFPTGQLPSRRWRPVAWVGAAGIVSVTLGNMFAPGVIPDTKSVNPLGIGGPVGQVLHVFEAGFAAVLLAGLASLVSLIVRYRRADAVEQEQLKWLVYAAGLILVAVLAGTVVQDSVQPVDLATNLQNAIISLAFVFVPLAIGIAVLKYRLYDIDVVINRTVVFGLLAGFITAVYVAIVVGLGALIGQGTSKPNLALSILATAVVAVAFQPVRDRVQKLANRLVYGKRATPYEVLSEFSSRMAGAYATEDLLPRMVRILAEGTGARTAVVWLRVGDQLKAEAGWPQDDLPAAPLALSDADLPEIPEVSLALPVVHQGELLGALSISKAPGERLTPAEEHLARDLASGAGLVLRNVRLTEELLARLEELRASRQRLVAASDAERRRLERNIHDGAQQQLVALTIKVRLARSLTERDPQKAEQLLAQAEAEVAQSLEDLRDLARGIYPPLLADQGLLVALESQARRAPMPVEVEGSGIGRFPPEQEAAAYFCALEALQNVSKYAAASTATVRLARTDDELTFEVSDDGAGFDPSTTSYGTGLQGMADRLAALGGELRVESVPGCGTVVAGRIPAHERDLVG